MVGKNLRGFLLFRYSRLFLTLAVGFTASYQWEKTYEQIGLQIGLLMLMLLGVIRACFGE